MVQFLSEVKAINLYSPQKFYQLQHALDGVSLSYRGEIDAKSRIEVYSCLVAPTVMQPDWPTIVLSFRSGNLHGLLTFQMRLMNLYELEEGHQVHFVQTAYMLPPWTSPDFGIVYSNSVVAAPVDDDYLHLGVEINLLSKRDSPILYALLLGPKSIFDQN